MVGPISLLIYFFYNIGCVPAVILFITQQYYLVSKLFVWSVKESQGISKVNIIANIPGKFGRKHYLFVELENILLIFHSGSISIVNNGF